uniref:Uncharacterized protein n=1 Tax=viral metagenome TaxID=1070528 RepID=A0A6C0D446_9ZZZZ
MSISFPISPTSLYTFDVSANLTHLKHQYISNPNSMIGSIAYDGLINIPVIVASASNDIHPINIAVFDVTSIGCNWTTSEISDRIDFIIYSNDN